MSERAEKSLMKSNSFTFFSRVALNFGRSQDWILIQDFFSMNHRNIICLMDFLQFSQQNSVIQSWKHFKWVNFNELFQGFFSLLFFQQFSLNSIEFFSLRSFLETREKRLLSRLIFLYCTLRKTFLYSSSCYFSVLKFKALGERGPFCTARRFQIDCGIFSIRKIWNTEKNVWKKLDCACCCFSCCSSPVFDGFVLLTTLCCFFYLIFSSVLLFVSSNWEILYFYMFSVLEALLESVGSSVVVNPGCRSSLKGEL